MSIDESRIPVIVGVGELNDRPAPGQQGLDSAALMAAAISAADEDALGGWIEQCSNVLVVPQISFQIDVAEALSNELRIPKDLILMGPMPSGDTPIRLLADAANAIGRGNGEVFIVVGGEALRTAAAQRLSRPLFNASLKVASDLRRKYGLINPSEIFPLYENAYRAARGQSLEEGQKETGEIWSAMSRVASSSQGAWLQTEKSAEEITTPSPANKMIAFPFTKFMVANSSVNQGAALIVTSLAKARAMKYPIDRLIYVGAGACAHEPHDPFARSNWTITPAMQVSIDATLAANNLTVDEIDYVELYSCFPCVPKMARDHIGWDKQLPVTVHGGLTFGGGPIANYMTHAVSAMVRALREGKQTGFLFANGGFFSHNHSIVLSRKPRDVKFPIDYDHQETADSIRGSIPALTDEYEGPAPVETFTVIYDSEGNPKHGIVLSRPDADTRVIAKVPCEDIRSISVLTGVEVEPVGYVGVTRRVGDELMWSAA